MKKHIYRTRDVYEIRISEEVPLLKGGCIVALDVAKVKFVAALATLTGEVVKLFRFEHPTQTRAFLKLVGDLETTLGRGNVKVAMEPTGSYGDAVRHQLMLQGLPVFMVSPKRTHDSQALFDNVSSLHDPKSATLVAKLCGMGLATEWKPGDQLRTRLRALVELRQHEQEHFEKCQGRLEALLARHWPEFGLWLSPREQVSALVLLSEVGSPDRVRREPEETRVLLQSASRERLSSEAIEGTLEGARSTLGLPMLLEEQQHVSLLATQALDNSRRMDALEQQMRTLSTDEGLVRLQTWMGTFTAAVLLSMCDPRQYASSHELVKACGLNLREKSSGEHKGRLSITKRGPGLVRRVLYMFALRMLQESPVVKAWYCRRSAYTQESKQRAVVAVMRKLLKAAFHVARGATFDAKKLFDERRLSLPTSEVVSVRQQPKARKQPRALTRAVARAEAPT
jgi:transposase